MKFSWSRGERFHRINWVSGKRGWLPSSLFKGKVHKHEVTGESPDLWEIRFDQFRDEGAQDQSAEPVSQCAGKPQRTPTTWRLSENGNPGLQHALALRPDCVRRVNALCVKSIYLTWPKHRIKWSKTPHREYVVASICLIRIRFNQWSLPSQCFSHNSHFNLKSKWKEKKIRSSNSYHNLGRKKRLKKLRLVIRELRKVWLKGQDFPAPCKFLGFTLLRGDHPM